MEEEIKVDNDYTRGFNHGYCLSKSIHEGKGADVAPLNTLLERAKKLAHENHAWVKGVKAGERKAMIEDMDKLMKNIKKNSKGFRP